MHFYSKLEWISGSTNDIGSTIKHFTPAAYIMSTCMGARLWILSVFNINKYQYKPDTYCTYNIHTVISKESV
jgi:hypothetical protein